MESFLRDFRYAFRVLLRKPAFTAVAVLSLALGIGANTTIFTLVNEFFLKPLPVEEPDRVVTLHTTDARIPGQHPLSHHNWRDLRDDGEVFSHVVAYDWAPMSVDTGGEPAFVFGQMVSGDYFEALGIQAFKGRTFLPEEDETPGSHAVVVLSYRFWSQRLGSDPDVVGRTLGINGHPFTVVGVAPSEFRGTTMGLQPEIWAPMMMNQVFRPDPELNWYGERRGLFLFAFARLADGVEVSEAEARLGVLGNNLAAAYPDDNEGRSFGLRLLREGVIAPGLRDGLVRSTSLLTVIVFAVLLIACANVANLLLARATERRREIATRLALGAGRRRLISQLLTESLAISLLGAAGGLLLAFWSRNVLRSFLPSLPLPVTLDLDLAIDPRVLLFTLGLAVLTGLLFGLVPAIQATRPGMVAAIKDQGDLTFGPSRKLTARNLLVVVQVALSLVALFGAGLFVRSLAAAQQSDPGYETDKLVVMSFDLGLQGYDRPRGEQFLRQVVERVEALPGVEAATVAQAGPFQGSLQRSMVPEGQDGENDRSIVEVNVVAAGYFETLGISLVRGRGFLESDRDDSVPVVIVNETLAEKFWPGADPVGKRFTFFGFERPFEVVGVAEDLAYHNLGEDPIPYVYQPLGQQYMSGMTLIAKTGGEPASLLQTIQGEIRELDSGLPLTGVSTVADLMANTLWAPRAGASLLGVFGALALILAIFGLYGVMTFAVQRRSREIGIRMALGAERPRVLTMVLGQGMMLVGAGLVLGLGLAIFASRLVASLLFVSATDPLAFVSTTAILLVAGLGASLLPALKATGVHPVAVLRFD